MTLHRFLNFLRCVILPRPSENITSGAPSMTDSPEQPPMVRLRLKILGEPVAVEAPAPPEYARLDEVLPLMRRIDDHAVDLTVRRTAAAGKTVSCSKGCAACCRA